MGKSNVETIKYAEKFLDQGGSVFRKYSGMTSGPYCAAYVTYVFHKSKNALLFCDGAKVTYCPTAYDWCLKNLAFIPLFLTLPGDLIYFDWQPNGIPDHIGFVSDRISDTSVATIEGNTTKAGIVAERIRTESEILGVFRPHYAATFDLTRLLDVDGSYGYNSIAMTQAVLGVTVDGILGKETVRALQKMLGVKEDGWWGPATSKKLQTFLGVKSDGYFGIKSVKAFQKWLNANAPSGIKISAKAKQLAYSGSPSKAKYPSGKPKTAYKTALKEVFPDRTTWGKAARLGASCDVFVATVLRASGVDPDCPRGLKEQIPYFKTSKKYKEVSYKKSKLKAGDVVVYQRKKGGSHIIIIENDKLHICEANHAGTYGITRTTATAINYRLKTSNKAWIKIYRAK